MFTIWRFCSLTLISLVASVSAAASQGGKQDRHSLLEAPLSNAGEDNTLLGSYLAGRVARSYRDNEAAAAFYRKALDQDPSNQFILEEAFQLEIATGNAPEAKKLAARLLKLSPNHTFARFFMGVDAFKRGDYAAAEGHFRNRGKQPTAILLTTSLARAWTLVARGRNSEALKALEAVFTEDAGQVFLHLHTGLIADFSGRQKLARPAYATAFKRNSRNRRIAEAYARHAAVAKETDLAQRILAPFVSRALPDPIMKALYEEISSGGVPRLSVTQPLRGIAEVFCGIGEALTSDPNGADTALMYLQLALFADPDFVIARYTLGEVYETVKSYEMAIAAFERVPESSPLWFTAQTRKAFHLHTLDRSPEAQALLKQLLERDKQNLQILQVMGTILRGEKKYEEAAEYYTAAINAIPYGDRRAAVFYFNRGVAYERWKRWDLAEPDFKRSLELDGEQAQVLNYLGYSWVDQNINVPEAMALIKKAVALKPKDGFIVDSLGWAYYRQRNYKEAVKHLDAAVELQPEDPVINDHLGDAFWRVGRKREAKYQWSLALSLNPEPEDKHAIKRKLAFATRGDKLGVISILNQDWVSTMTRAERVFAKTLAKPN